MMFIYQNIIHPALYLRTDEFLCYFGNSGLWELVFKFTFIKYTNGREAPTKVLIYSNNIIFSSG